MKLLGLVFLGRDFICFVVLRVDGVRVVVVGGVSMLVSGV